MFRFNVLHYKTSDFNRFSSVTAMLQHLSWPSLQLRRKISRLQALFKILHQDYSLSIPPHFISMTRSTKLYHPHRFILPNPFTYSYQQSFFSRSIKDWNNLPSSIKKLTLFQRNCKHIVWNSITVIFVTT